MSVSIKTIQKPSAQFPPTYAAKEGSRDSQSTQLEASTPPLHPGFSHDPGPFLKKRKWRVIGVVVVGWFSSCPRMCSLLLRSWFSGFQGARPSKVEEFCFLSAPSNMNKHHPENACLASLASLTFLSHPPAARLLAAEALDALATRRGFTETSARRLVGRHSRGVDVVVA